MELHLKITGWLLVVLSLIHIGFPKYFGWKKELSTLNLINRQMMYVHTFFLALVLLLTGVLCIKAAPTFVETSFGRNISLGLFIFWFFRLLVQFFGYSSKLWKGKKFETIVHIAFSILWTYISLVFLFVYFWKGNA